ncbi:MAG TPA: SRPBCC family protein [Bryobacteraceae bacterium]|nr:SRPBCC family protein [Bryobacteraceae bacterium]
MAGSIPASSIIHDTFVIERTYPQAPERVFAFLSDPAKKRRWFGDGSHHEVERFELDFREGGREIVHSRFLAGSPFPGVALTNEGAFQHIEPNRCVVTASTMSLGGRRISATQVTMELLPTDSGGTTLKLTHQGIFFEGSDGPEMRKAGWHELLDRFGAELNR